MFIVFYCDNCHVDSDVEFDTPLSARYPRLEAFDVDTVCPECDHEQTFIIDPKEYL